MNWNDIDTIIYDGTPEQIDKVRCPECSGVLKLRYFPIAGTVEVHCVGCGAAARQSGVREIPNFARIVSA